MRRAPYFPAGPDPLSFTLRPWVTGGATLAELVDWMHCAPVAEGESYLHGDSVLEAVRTCPHCGGDCTQVVGDPGHPDLGGCTEEEVHCGTCEGGVVPAARYAELAAEPGGWVRPEPSYDWDL